MNAEHWAKVDRYVVDLVVRPDEALEAALRDSAAAGLPAINVSAAQGKWLHVQARSIGARNILEIGTLGGYSTIWLARALPADGKLITLEASAKHAEVARANLARAGVSERVELILGRAGDTLPQLAAAGRGPFDLIFIDADKPNVPLYWDWSLRLLRPGGMIIVDNVVRKGAVIDAASNDENVQAMRRFLEILAAETRVTATVIQMVGSKGYDGMAVAVVNE